MGKSKRPSEIMRDRTISNANIVRHCNIAKKIMRKQGGKWVFVTNSGASKERQKGGLAYCKRKGYKKCVVHKKAYTATDTLDVGSVAIYGKI